MSAQLTLVLSVQGTTDSAQVSLSVAVADRVAAQLRGCPAKGYCRITRLQPVGATDACVLKLPGGLIDTDMTMPLLSRRWKEGAALFREAKAWVQAADAYSHAGARWLLNSLAAAKRDGIDAGCFITVASSLSPKLFSVRLQCVTVPAGLFSDAMTACRDGAAFSHGEQLLLLWEAEVSRDNPQPCVAERHARVRGLGYLPAVCYYVSALQGSRCSVPMLTVVLHSLQSTSGSPAISAEQLLSLKGDHIFAGLGTCRKEVTVMAHSGCHAASPTQPVAVAS